MIHSYILTGFLGSGKTTTLTNIIKEHFFDKRVAIVVNEFGSVGIDGDILSNVYSQVLEITQGCICCQLSDEFSKGIKEIVSRYNPEIIFVETSGVSEPFPIFLSLNSLKISIDGVICVVDSKNFNSYKDNITAQKQIGSSNIILLNKIDLINKDELKDVEGDVNRIKNENDIKSTISGSSFFKNYIVEHTNQGEINKQLFNTTYRVDELLHIDSNYNNHTKIDSIEQKVCYIKKDSTSDDINTLLRSLPKDVYRAKGVIKVKGFEKPQLINYAFGIITQEDFDNYDGESIIVFIGKSIEQKINFLSKMVDTLIIPKFRVNYQK
jgi:G3E family GTPase